MFEFRALAELQAQADVALTRPLPALLPLRRERLLASPHAFFRGSAGLFYEVLARHPELAEGPEGEGWIVGDMHLENAGVWRDADGEPTFDLNDFDDCAIGPRRLDVLRLLSGVLLGAEQIGTEPRGQGAMQLLGAALDGYTHPPTGALPDPVQRLMSRAAKRSAKDLLDERAPVTDGRRRFARGERYLDLPFAAAREVPTLLRGWRAPKDGARGKAWPVLDAAWRVAGTGSLGKARIAVLTENPDGELRLLDFKEASVPAPALLPGVHSPADTPAARVVTGARALLGPGAPSQVAASPSMVARRLRPQEDKLALTRFGEDAEHVVRTIAGQLRRAHDRSGPGDAASAWSAADRDGLAARAVTLASLFEAIYLTYASIVAP